MVKFLTKKRKKHYIGLVLSEDKQYGECAVKFLRRKGDVKFVYPDQEDVATVSLEDTVKVLTNPNERRNQYFFNPSELENIENLE